MRYLKQFEGNRMFREYGPNYRRPIIEQLEDLLIEVFDKWKLGESTQGVSSEYSWWNDLNYHITIGNIPHEDELYLILDDLFRIKAKIEERLGRKIKITNGQNGGYRGSTYWISIEPI